jgi:hypothetical protein
MRVVRTIGVRLPVSVHKCLLRFFQSVKSYILGTGVSKYLNIFLNN